MWWKWFGLFGFLGVCKWFGLPALLLGLKIYWSINTSCPRYARDRMSRHWTQEKKVATFQKSKVTIYYHRHLLKVLFSFSDSATYNFTNSIKHLFPTLSQSIIIYHHLLSSPPFINLLNFSFSKSATYNFTNSIYHHCHNLLSSITHPLSIPWWQTGQMEGLYRWGGYDQPYSDHQLEGSLIWHQLSYIHLILIYK